MHSATSHLIFKKDLGFFFWKWRWAVLQKCLKFKFPRSNSVKQQRRGFSTDLRSLNTLFYEFKNWIYPYIEKSSFGSHLKVGYFSVTFSLSLSLSFASQFPYPTTFFSKIIDRHVLRRFGVLGCGPRPLSLSFPLIPSFSSLFFFSFLLFFSDSQIRSLLSYRHYIRTRNAIGSGYSPLYHLLKCCENGNVQMVKTLIGTLDGEREGIGRYFAVELFDVAKGLWTVGLEIACVIGRWDGE